MLFYDRADNLLERPQSEIEAQTPSTPALSPQGDRLLQFQGWQYHHDAYGNVISREHPNQVKQTYQYDGDNRLVIAQTSDVKAQYHYDALGRRIHKVVESRAHGKLTRHETHFVWQGLRLLQEQDINTGKHQTYCYEEHGSYTPLAVIVKQPAGYRYYWHHCDINSAPLDVTNEQGNTVWSGKYERFGFVRSSPLSFYSAPERKMESFEQNLRYAGQYFDNETGLHFNTFRFYDPQIGRFIMPDPIGLLGGVNLYQYAPNPLGWIDPWGLAGNPATATHITYQGIDKATGKPYVGYASMQGNQTAQNVLKYRYGNDFSRFGGTPPVILYDGYGQKGKDIARGLEQRRFEQLGGLEGTANKQNPVGQGNARRTEYLNAADEHLNSKQTGTKKGGKC
nr:RHS repeat-associated core domain-containing protein [Providencia stuartii]